MLRSEGRAHAMSDERILGESDFVDSVLSGAGEKLDRRYELQALGYDLRRIATRAAEIFEVGVHEIFSKGRQDRKVKARSLTCFWAARELGMSLADLGRAFEMSIPGIGYAVERGELLAHDNKYQLIR
jgi:chromosomal replication initiation ATPase DnaA